MIYPFSKELQQAAGDFENGNFGLWFYKLVPLDDQKDFKVGTPSSGDKNVVSFYRNTYDLLKKSNELQRLLEKRHADQRRFCRMHGENGANVIEIRAELQSSLITGIGKTHPNEVGMTFDHTMGIPYLPATGIKGLVRLAHILNLLADQEKADLLIQGDELDDTHPISLIPEIFGGDLKGTEETKTFRGKVVFLDAYPENIPDLHVDIMNPHYGKYYGDDNAIIPPADYLDPVPVQFLTVKKGEFFVFRAVVHGSETLKKPLAKAFHNALMDQGFGAKTAVGYGRFHIQSTRINETESHKVQTVIEPEKPAQRKIWEGATLTYTPGNKEITATSSLGKATVIGKNLVPEVYHKKLFGKKKRANPEKVTVQSVGNAWRIVEIT